MSKKVIQKLRKIGYSRAEIARATGIAPRTQTRILNIRGYTKRVSRGTQEKLTNIAPQYEQIKYKRSRVIDLDRFSDYMLFDAKIGDKRFQTVRETFQVEELDAVEIRAFINNKAPHTRLVSAKIGFYVSGTEARFGKSTPSYDTSADRSKSLEDLGDNVLNLIDQGLHEAEFKLKYNYKTGQYEPDDDIDDEEEDQMIEFIEVQLVGIVKGI